mgnify:FL=1
MDERDSINPTPISDDLMPGAKLSPYDLLIRQSRKMGKFATRGFDVTKEFLKQDVSALHPDKLLFGQEIRTEMTPVLDSKENLNKIVEKTHQILAYARTVVLPSNVFPDTVIVDRTKITITKRTFFWSSEVISIRIEDVLNVTASTGPFFGTLTISSRVMNSTDHYEINALFRRDALYLKQIIQGYVIAQHNQIQTSHLDKNELIKTLLEIGRDSDY